MGELNMQEMPLPALFEQARKIHILASESTIDQDTVKKGCEILKQCDEMIGKLGLFSLNETKDDISTAKLKYILVPYYLAELTEKIAEDDRIKVLKASEAKLKEFISFCETMELVPQEEIEISAQGGANSFVDRRAKKIARFKRQRAAESKLLELKERKERRGRSTKAAALSSPVEAGEDDESDDDGEEEREAWLTTISLALYSGDDILILGLAIDKVSQNGEIKLLLGEEEKEVLPCCLLLCLTNDGRLSIFHFASATAALVPPQTADFKEKNDAFIVPSSQDVLVESSSVRKQVKQVDSGLQPHEIERGDKIVATSAESSAAVKFCSEEATKTRNQN